MSDLACADCKALHDFDLAPDTGLCIICGGNLVEDETEREEVGAGAFKAGLKEVVQTVNESLATAGMTTAHLSLGRGKKKLS